MGRGFLRPLKINNKHMKFVITVLCIVAFCMNLNAEVSEKKYEKTFPKDKIGELVLSNEYGQIDVEQTDGSEISVSVTMQVTAKTVAKADETLDLLDIKETLGSSFLNIATTFGKDMAIKQLLSSVSLQINYKVGIPKGIKLRLIASDCNVFIDDFDGEINADIRNGNFKANSVKGAEFYIKQDKGSFEVADVDIMGGDFKNATVRIESGNEVKLETSSTSGDLLSIEKLNIRSSGGEIKLGQIEDLTGSSSFTKYEVQDIGNILNMDMKMGEINVRNIHFNFSEIRLKGSFTKVGLTFMEGAGYNLEVKRNKSLKMDLPRGMTLEERPTTERNMLIGTKFVGDTKYTGKVFLELSNGNLYIQ